jgi:hypothetical protein
MRYQKFAITFFAACALFFTSCASENAKSKFSIAPDGEISGTVVIDAGTCDELGNPSGSWLRMIEPGGNVLAGPYITNYDSNCSEQTYSLLSPGKVGLKLGKFQRHPNPAFDAATNGLADEIFSPVRFYSVNFAISTESQPEKIGSALSPPRFFVESTGDEGSPKNVRLTANLQSLFVGWNGEFFEQGGPHPEGFTGATTTPFGNINLETGQFTLQWSSQVDAGSFDGFIGQWQLTGVLIPNK